MNGSIMLLLVNIDLSEFSVAPSRPFRRYWPVDRQCLPLPRFTSRARWGPDAADSQDIGRLALRLHSTDPRSIGSEFTARERSAANNWQRSFVREAGHPTTIAKAIGYANVGIALGRGIDRANQGFPLLQAQWAEYAPSRMLRGAYPHPPHPRYETADLAMIRQGI